MSRFIAAQRTAFRKLLKKYKKWSRSTGLDETFGAEVLNRSTSFTKLSLNEQFDTWTEILQSIRVATKTGTPILSISRKAPPPSTPSPSTEAAPKPRPESSIIVTQLNEALSSANDVNFDTAFSETPLGDLGSRAVYWVDQEQLIELQVLLMQHLRLYLTKPVLVDSASSLSASPVTTRRSSLSTRQDGTGERESDSGIIYMDDLEDYAQRHVQATVGDSEDALGETQTRPAAAARWTSTMDDATLAFRRYPGLGKLGVARVRRKHLGALLDADRDFKPWQRSGSTTPLDGNFASFAQDNTSPDQARSLLQKRRNLQPLVAVFSRRTRFLGLGNSASIGQWATLDAGVCISKVTKEDLGGKDWSANLSRDATNFPFAVLKIRQEGKFAKNLCDVLDKSHLVGFSSSRQYC